MLINITFTISAKHTSRLNHETQKYDIYIHDRNARLYIEKKKYPNAPLSF